MRATNYKTKAFFAIYKNTFFPVQNKLYFSYVFLQLII